MSSNGSSCPEQGVTPEVAVVLGPDGRTASLDEPGRVVVLRRDRGAWEPVRETAFAIDPGAGLRDLRHAMQELIEFLGECRVVVARTARGVPFFELEKARCTVWEIGDDPIRHLEEIWQDGGTEESVEASAVPVPEELTPGNYYLSIREIQEENVGVSSKQVLQPFIRRGAFRSLVVVCNHVPPWLSMDAISTGCHVETQRIGDHEHRVKLTKRDAGGCC